MDTEISLALGNDSDSCNELDVFDRSCLEFKLSDMRADNIQFCGAATVEPIENQPLLQKKGERD